LHARHAGRARDPIRETRLGVAAIGAIVAVFSLAPSIGLAFAGALVFGAAAAFTLAAGMGAIQAATDGHRRVLAFAAFHVVIRLGLGIAAIAAGVAGDVLGETRLVADLEPARVVLLGSGLLVLLASVFVRSDGEHRVAA
jgi:hypothetical protein